MRARTYGETITVEELEAEPYPIYRRLRDEEPVAWVPAVDLWFVTRWDDVTFVGSRPDLFTADVDGSPLERTLGQNVLTVDGGLHKRMRAAMEPALRTKAVDEYAPRVVTPITDELFAGFAERGEAELMSEFLEPLSVLSLGAVLGLGELDADTLRRWFVGLASGGANFERDPKKQALADATSREVDEVVAPILDRLERRPDGSLLAGILHAEPPGGRLSREEVTANLKLILLGGMQEPGHAAGNCVFAILSHPEAAAALAADPDLAGRAVEEGLRWLSPVGTLTRQVTEAVTLAGVRLEKGARLAAVISSANRDERHWEDADRFDIRRDLRTHRAFGVGPHYCVGHWLSRYEVKIPVRMLFERLPNLRLDPCRPPRITGWEFRGPKQLHVLWDA